MKGVEVGHVFYLGTKYSKVSINSKVLDHVSSEYSSHSILSSSMSCFSSWSDVGRQVLEQGPKAASD
jgi:hypothetical protein